MKCFLRSVKRNNYISFFKNETGMGTVEIVIIIAILVALALIFRNSIMSLISSLIDKIQADAKSAAGL